MGSYIPVDKLTDIISNKYEAVLVAAREARVQNSISRLKDLDPDTEQPKVTSLALGRVIDNEVKFFYGEPKEAATAAGDTEILDVEEDGDDAGDD
ncbi:MAG: DNA-directed RNA polymerase subunit omega [Candidatus Krumholzibacteriota bacterium]|nr:DNA-directed RNA polymerase subunit omega [Candidatus Krumholzibacteriota bacterium]